MRGPGTNQGAVNAEVLIRKQACTVSRDQNLANQPLDGIVSNKAITTGWPRAIVRKAGMIPDLAVDGKTDKPTLQHVVAQVLA